MVLDLLGTRAFLPTLCAQLQKASPQPIPLDPVILRSILLVLAVGHRKNLILRAVNPEEVPIIARIAEWILSMMFNLSTHRLKIRSPKSKSPDHDLANPTAFLRSLFLVHTLSVVEVPHYKRTSGTKPASILGPASNDMTQADPFADGRRASESTIAQSHVQYSTNAGVTHLSSGSHSPHHSHKRVSRSGSHYGSKSKSRWRSSTTSLHVPSALVITGLEDASDASQRALVRVLADGRIVLPKHDTQVGSSSRHPEDSETETWDLPEDFIMIYVTYWDPRKRPAIHKSLLDKFAMSTNIAVPPKVRKAIRSLSTASSTGAVTQNPFASRPDSPHLPRQTPTPLGMSSTLTSSATAKFPAASSRCSPSPTNLEAAPAPSLAMPANFLSCLRHATMHRTQFSPLLNLYLQDLFSAARFDSPELDGSLLTAKAMEDAEMLVRACRVLGTELGGWELVRGGASDAILNINEPKMEEREGDSGSTNGYDWEFETGYDPSGSIAIDIGIEDTNSEGKSVDIQEQLNERPVDRRSPRITLDESNDAAEGATSAGVLFDVSEADIARIIPRVISHRIKLRESWRDEVLASAVCGATFSVGQEYWKTEPRSSQDRLGRGQRTSKEVEGDLTVKDVLVRILQRV